MRVQIRAVQIMHRNKKRAPENRFCFSGAFWLCHSKNKPPAMQGEDRSLDISMNSCAKIKVGLQNHK